MHPVAGRAAVHVVPRWVWAVVVPVSIVFGCAGGLFVLERVRGTGGYVAF